MGNYPFVAPRVVEHVSPTTALAAETPVELRKIDSETAFFELSRRLTRERDVSRPSGVRRRDE
jgi:hypothetical protein